MAWWTIEHEAPVFSSKGRWSESAAEACEPDGAASASSAGSCVGSLGWTAHCLRKIKCCLVVPTTIADSILATNLTQVLERKDVQSSGRSRRSCGPACDPY